MDSQYNKITGLAYNGKNQVNLLAVKSMQGYKANEWLTFVQARGLKRKVLKGSKSVQIFKGFKQGSKIDKKGKIKNYSFGGYANIFNIEQTEKY